MPNEVESLRKLLTAERAALRLYEEVDEATRLTELQACGRSHEHRAVFLSGQLRRLGAELDRASPCATLYGLAFKSIPNDRALLIAALLKAERHGERLYQDLCGESPLEERVLRELCNEQARTVKLLAASLGRAEPRTVRVSLTRPIARVQRSTIAANKAS